MLKHRLFLCMLLRKIFYFIYKYELIQINTTFLWSILSFDSLVAALFLLVITGVVLSRLSYFNLVFPPVISYTSMGDPNENKNL